MPAPSARHSIRCRSNSLTLRWCRSPLTAVWERSRRLVSREAVSSGSSQRLAFPKLAFGSVRQRSASPRSCPYSVRRLLTVSGRRTASPTDPGFPWMDVASRKRDDGPRMARKSERGGSSFPRLLFLHQRLRSALASSNSRKAIGPAILSRQSSKPASRARPRVTASSAIPLSITR